jgi:hypothetical protein
MGMGIAMSPGQSFLVGLALGGFGWFIGHWVRPRAIRIVAFLLTIPFSLSCLVFSVLPPDSGLGYGLMAAGALLMLALAVRVWQPDGGTNSKG